MSIITGKVTKDGATVLVVVGVSRNRRRVLERMGFPAPGEISVKAQLDTGSCVTGFVPELLRALGVEPIDTIPIHTPSTRRGEPRICALFNVSVALGIGLDRHVLPSVDVIEAGGFEHGEEVQAIIGRDILDRCIFHYDGLHHDFYLAF